MIPVFPSRPARPAHRSTWLLLSLMAASAPAAAQSHHAAPPPGEDRTVDAATRKRVIEKAAAQLKKTYVFPDLAKSMADTVSARLARGEYDAVNDGPTFARTLTEHLREVSRDKHLRVNYAPAGGQRGASQDAVHGGALARANCGFDRSETLDGNVGFVKFNFFAPPPDCGTTATKHMTAVADADALIIDLRENGGGHPAMVAYISSYLFSKRTHLNDIWERPTNRTQEFWTRPELPGAKFPDDKPVYVLTSSYTFSGAEEFSYNLKALKRATIVGETTGGGAHPVEGHRIDDRFVIGVPFARAINPITKTNWEGTGVEPDVKVPAADALATALRLIAERSARR